MLSGREERSLVAIYLLIGEAITCANVVVNLYCRLASNCCRPVTNSRVYGAKPPTNYNRMGKKKISSAMILYKDFYNSLINLVF